MVVYHKSWRTKVTVNQFHHSPHSLYISTSIRLTQHRDKGIGTPNIFFKQIYIVARLSSDEIYAQSVDFETKKRCRKS